MPLVVNTNVSSLTVQRNLSAQQADSSTAFQRLSSGLRINSSKDDAAGLAISNRFTAQINGLNQAVRNSGDGISLAQTAEGALGEITNNLQRIRELAVQASNATNSNSDRAALQTEVDQLIEEIDRVADNTSFNDVKLLDGTFTSQIFQVGANAGESITISQILDANAAELGSLTQNTSAGRGGLEASIATDSTGIGASIAAGTLQISGPSSTGLVNLAAIDADSSAADRVDAIIEAVNAVSTQTGVGARATDTGFELVSEGDFSIAGFTSIATGIGAANFDTTASVDGINALSVESYSSAQSAIKQVDSALAEINEGRAVLGAVQSRFESTVSSLQTTSENLTASRSRIQDADFAAETANLTRSQILQQAGISVLSQANSAPQQVLALLQ
jgi:flagellin